MVETFEAKHLSFAYGGTTILDNVSLCVSRGMIASLVGSNGAGKSTLIKCLCRILEPGAGSVYIHGEDVSALSHAALSRRVGYVPQSVSTAFPHTVFDEVLIGRKPYIGFRVRPSDVEAVAGILMYLGIDHLAERYFDELSGGERQKVTIARALAQQPGVLLLDEPTSNLDIRHQLEVMNVLRRLADERRIIVVMAVHDLNLAARYSDLVLMMSNQRISDWGPPADVLTSGRIEAVYGVRADVIYRPGNRPYVIPLTPSDTKQWSDRKRDAVEDGGAGRTSPVESGSW